MAINDEKPPETVNPALEFVVRAKTHSSISNMSNSTIAGPADPETNNFTTKQAIELAGQIALDCRAFDSAQV